MAYNKKTWISNEIISKDALNNIENGIEAVEQSIPKKTSQLENDSGYITEHLDLSNYAEKDELHEHKNKDVLDEIDLVRIQAWDNAANGENVNLDNYVTKEIFEEFVNNSIEHIFITEAEYEALPEEDKNKDDVLYLITDGESTVIDFDNIDNRVKALEEVEHVSLEQYNTLLNRIVLLEEALNDLKSEEPSIPEEPDTPDVSNLQYIKLFDSEIIGNTEFGNLCVTECTDENNYNGWFGDGTITYDFYINNYEAAWFSFSNSVDFSNYEKIMIKLAHDTTMKPLIGVSRNSEGNNYGYASELNMSRIEFMEVSSTNEDHYIESYIFDIKDLIKTGNSGYLGFYFLRNNEGDGEITIHEVGVYKKK